MSQGTHNHTHEYKGGRHGRASRTLSKLPKAITLDRLEALLKSEGAESQEPVETPPDDQEK